MDVRATANRLGIFAGLAVFAYVSLASAAQGVDLLMAVLRGIGGFAIIMVLQRAMVGVLGVIPDGGNEGRAPRQLSSEEREAEK
jgi:hypothetical protein